MAELMKPLAQRALAAVTVLAAMMGMAAGAPAGSAPEATPTAGVSDELTLEQCLTEAMEKNHRRPASRFAVAVAEAQHRQALAGYWPQISANAG